MDLSLILATTLAAAASPTAAGPPVVDDIDGRRRASPPGMFRPLWGLPMGRARLSLVGTTNPWAGALTRDVSFARASLALSMSIRPRLPSVLLGVTLGSPGTLMPGAESRPVAELFIGVHGSFGGFGRWVGRGRLGVARWRTTAPR